MLGLPLKCFHNSSEWKAFQGLSSHNDGFGIALQLTIIWTTILFLNNSWYLIQPGMYCQNIKKIKGFQQVGIESVWSPGEIWPAIYIIVWYLQCQLITWSDYLSGRTIEDLISSKTVARGRVLTAPGVLVTARRVVGGASQPAASQPVSQVS